MWDCIARLHACFNALWQSEDNSWELLLSFHHVFQGQNSGCLTSEANILPAEPFSQLCECVRVYVCKLMCACVCASSCVHVCGGQRILLCDCYVIRCLLSLNLELDWPASFEDSPTCFPSAGAGDVHHSAWLFTGPRFQDLNSGLCACIVSALTS